MEHSTNPSQFTIPSNLKALGDRNENIIVYYHHSASDSANKSSPFEIIRVIPTAHKGNITLLKPFFQASTNKHYLISSSFDKDVKLWDLSTEPATLLDSLHHPKKVDFGFVDIERAKLTYSDKTGDIFELTFHDLKLSKPEMTQANMDTLIYLERHRLSDGTDLVVMADEYEKIKILKYPEIYHILNIFSPYKDVNFQNVLNLSPNALVARLSNGHVDLISLKSIEENEYTSEKLDLSTKIEGKKIYEIYKVNSDYFIAVDLYFTTIVIVRISEGHVVEDKVVDISGLGILKSEKDHDTKRFIEAERDGETLVLYFKYERSQEVSEGENGNKEEKDENEIKLHEGVYVKKLVVNL